MRDLFTNTPDAAAYARYEADRDEADEYRDTVGWPEPDIEPCPTPGCEHDAGHPPPCDPYPDQREENP